MAIPHFLKATEKTDLKFKPNRYSEKNAPYHSWYYLGDAYAFTNKLDEALDAYSTFQSLKNFEKKYNLGVTEERVKAVERAKKVAYDLFAEGVAFIKDFAHDIDDAVAVIVVFGEDEGFGDPGHSPLFPLSLGEALSEAAVFIGLDDGADLVRGQHAAVELFS